MLNSRAGRTVSAKASDAFEGKSPSAQNVFPTNEQNARRITGLEVFISFTMIDRMSEGSGISERRRKERCGERMAAKAEVAVSWVSFTIKGTVTDTINEDTDEGTTNDNIEYRAIR